MELDAIRKRIRQIEQFEQEIRASREMLNSELESEPLYLKSAEEAKTATAKKKRLKEEVLAKGANQKLVSEIKENQEEIATLKEILSAELIEIYSATKTDEIEDDEGAPRKFKVLVKLLPKKSYYRG